MSKMFKSKQQVDGKKLQAKLFDAKKDCFSRLRYLKELLATREIVNEKQFFFNHRSTIYGIFFDAFIQLDAAKHRGSGKSFSSISDYSVGPDGLSSSQREELDFMLFAFERMLLLLPEVLEQRWQINSIIFVFRKMLHYNNVLKVRMDGLRLFLIYYQILGERNIRETPQIEALYAALIPGVVSDLAPNLNPRNPAVFSGPITVAHLGDSPDVLCPVPTPGSFGPVQPFPNEPFITTMDLSSTAHLVASATPLGGSVANPNGQYQQFEYKLEIQRYFLEHLLTFSLSECSKIVWSDYRDRRSLRAFEFLMHTFCRIYLPYIFPKMAVLLNPDSPRKSWPIYTVHPTISVYKPPERIPTLRKYSDHLKQYFVFQPPNGTQLNPFVQLQTSIILWFTKYILDKDKNDGSNTLTPGIAGPTGFNLAGDATKQMHSMSQMNLAAHHSSMGASTNSLSSTGAYPTQPPGAIVYSASGSALSSTNLTLDYEREYIRSLLNSKRLYVDLILSLFNEALLLPFACESQDPLGTNKTPMRNVIKVFRQWIHKETTSPLPLFMAESGVTPNSSPSSLGSGSRYGLEDSVSSGLMNLLNVFVLSSANVFLLMIPSEQNVILELQVDVCKRVFNIYRFMVMKVDMDQTVWENLVQVLIQVTRSILTRDLPAKREDTLGGRLAPALFQTLIVTWIKANLNVPVSTGLWEQFHELVSQLTRWEELINEWSNTMYILNRVMSRYVFNINLSDLPLDKAGNDRKKRMTIKAAAATATVSGTAQAKSSISSASGVSRGGEANQPHTTDGRHASITSATSSVALQRQASNDHSTLHHHRRTPYLMSHYQPYASVYRHRQFHDSTSIFKLHQSSRVRSLSDSCIVLSVHHSLCPLRQRTWAINGGGRTYAPFGGRSKRSSQKSRNSPRVGTRHLNHRRNLPMIDDDIGAEIEEMVENCTIVDTDMDANGHGGHELDYSDASSTVDSTADGYFNEGETISLAGGHYGKLRGLFRSHSAEDIYTVPVGDTSGRQGSIWSESLSIGGTITSQADGGSLKDQPLGFEGSGTSSTCSNSVTESMSISGISPGTSKSHDSRPILLGGTHKGWNAEISVILWRRMLGVLGDLNDIPDPAMHKLAFECLVKITDDFIKMKDNISYLCGIGVSSVGEGVGNQAQLLQPSLHYFTAWLFRATALPNEFKAGKLLAYKLLCIIALHRCEKTASGAVEVHNRDFLIHFYLAIKRALSTYDMELTCIIIKYCGQKFFSSALYGSSCLLFDFISAANMIVSSQETKWPRAEALHLLGSLIGFFDVYSNVLILRNTTSAPSLETYKDLKEHVLEILIIASKREQTGLGRSIALCSLGIFLYKELQNRAEHHRMKEVVGILIAGTRVSLKTRSNKATSPTPSNLDSTSKFNNRVLCRVACDQLRLQTDHAAYLVEKHPDLARKIIEGLCYTLTLHVDVAQQQAVFKDFKNLLISIQFTLAQWCMSVSKEFLGSATASRDYPNFLDAEANSKMSSSEEAPAPPAKQTLFELVIATFSRIANLNVSEIAQRRLPERQMETLNNSFSFSDMDTIDYTISSANTGGGGGGNSFLSPDTADGVTGSSPLKSSSADSRNADVNTVKRAAQLILMHFLTFVGHFPLPKLRTTSLCALINENDDNPCCPTAATSEKLELESLNSPNVLLFVVNGSCIISFVELSPDALDSSILTRLTAAASSASSSSPTSSSSSLNILKQRPIRIIIRNLLGKFSWSCIALQSPLLPEAPRPGLPSIRKPEPMIRSIATASNGHYHLSLESNLDDLDSSDLDEDDEGGDAGHHRQSLQKDGLERLISEIYEITPECRPSSPENGNFLQVLNSTPEAVDIVALFTNQHYQERQFHEEARYRKASSAAVVGAKSELSSCTASITSTSSVSTSTTTTSSLFADPALAFQQCRQLIEQTGFLSWEKRSSIDLLSKSQAMLRELRHLDAQRCRETHKIAIIYVAPGQESKDAILGNKAGSRTFEEFVSRLGWEVNLASHAGFMGGLEANLSTGLTAPYFADSFNEVIFHVSTRLEPVVSGSSDIGLAQSSPERVQFLMNKKMRHLGNDEVHIVWSEHYKEYRRNILATEFCDALIVIYPLPAATYPNLYRIQIYRKPEVPFFGPLFNGVVVHRDELAPLVRATAINASRAKRLYMSAYKHYFEERHDSIHSLASKHRERNTFEEYATKIFAPRYDQLGQQQGVSANTPTTDMDAHGSLPHLTIDQFLASTGAYLQSLSLSPSNADSLSLASTTASISVETMAATPTQPSTPQLSHQPHAAPYTSAPQYSTHPHALSVRGAPSTGLSGTGGASRPTSRTSFK